jgi:transcriptional regulator with XRE-family HTH domain
MLKFAYFGNMDYKMLKNFRQKNRITQQTLASRLGISRTLLSLYEQQKAHIPKRFGIHIKDICIVDGLIPPKDNPKDNPEDN